MIKITDTVKNLHKDKDDEEKDFIEKINKDNDFISNLPEQNLNIQLDFLIFK